MKKSKYSKIVISILLIIGMLISFNDVYAAGCHKCTKGKIRISERDREIVLSVSDVQIVAEKDIYHGPLQSPCNNCEETGRVKKTSTTSNNGTTGSGSGTTGSSSGTSGGSSTTSGTTGSGTGTSGGSSTTSGTTGSGSGTINTEVFKPSQLTENDYGSAFQIAGIIVNAITIIGTVIAVIGIMILGIKYMMGSVEQKAEYKKTMWPYIVGCIFIFAITTIVSVIYSLVSQI